MARAKYSPSEAKDFAKQTIHGIWTAFCVPETSDFEIDEAGLRHDIRRYIDEFGVGGLYVHGFFGNFWLLTMEERKRVTEIAIDEAAGKVPVSIRCAHQSLKDAIELVQHAEEAGADLISMVGPHMADGSEEMIVSFFTEIAKATNLGISVFNTRQAGYVMSPELMARLAKIPNIAAFKCGVSVGNTIRTRELVGDSMVVVEPGEKHFLTNMLEFGQTAIYTGANMMYDNGKHNPMLQYYKAAMAGDRARAIALFYELEGVRALHEEWITKPWKQRGLCPVARVKYWSELNGLTGGSVRPPLENVTDVEKAEFRERLDRVTSGARLAAA